LQIFNFSSFSFLGFVKIYWTRRLWPI